MAGNPIKHRIESEALQDLKDRIQEYRRLLNDIFNEADQQERRALSAGYKMSRLCEYIQQRKKDYYELGSRSVAVELPGIVGLDAFPDEPGAVPEIGNIRGTKEDLRGWGVFIDAGK